MNSTEQLIAECVDRSSSRLDLWIRFLKSIRASHMVELGVYRGDFASRILKDCDSIEKYYMIDPWRHLGDWNKPANLSDAVFNKFLSETKSKTEFASDKRIILRGKTIEVVEEISDGELDFVYIDGDHTLKGITIDLIRIFPKIRDGGWIGGDDFSDTVWQHATSFEPTLVFPFAVYFAEAVDNRIFALPNMQYLIEKNNTQTFSFIDLTGKYGNLSLGKLFHPNMFIKQWLKEKFLFMAKVVK